MGKGRSNYSFTINVTADIINQLINSYLSANDFKLENKNGETYYKSGDALLGYKGFSYSINGQTLNISAWLIGALGDFPIEQNSLNMLAMNYRNSLSTLFQQISNLNINQNNFMVNSVLANVNENIQTSNQEQQISNLDNNSQFTEKFQAETNKKQELMCEIGFWISIAGVFLAINGSTMGLFVYVIVFYFAYQGLKTRKKTKAKASIILAILSLVIVIFTLLSSY